MYQPKVVFCNGERGNISLTFREASHKQRSECRKLGAAPFGAPLSEAAFLEREEYLADRSLTRDGGMRYWCLTLNDETAQVVSTCKTIERELFVREKNEISQKKGYCIASVVTDESYRGYGLATLLLKCVAEWMDGPGDAVASMLYTSIGDFYVSRGWKKLPAFQSTLTLPLNGLNLGDQHELPNTKLLSTEDIAALAARDIMQIKEQVENHEVGDDEVLVAVLPTAPVIGWLHDRGDFTSLKTIGKVPHSRGSICVTGNCWLYWHHDFRKQQLAIQRIHYPAFPNETHIKELMGILIDALEEAERWNLPKVVIWDATQALHRVLQLVQDMLNIRVENEERTKSVTSLRWEGSNQNVKIKVLVNEHYAWS